jgi:Domain of unknown function (DUF5666)
MKRSILLVFVMCAVAMMAQDTAQPQNPPDQGNAQRERGAGRGHMRELIEQGKATAGTVTDVKDGALTLKTFRGDTAQVKLSDKTQVRKQGQPAKAADLKAGDVVVVEGQKLQDGSWAADAVMVRPQGQLGGARFGPRDPEQMQRFREGMGKEFIAGEVKEINGTKLTIDRMDNQRQTIEVDENTSFRKQGQSVTLAEIKVGDHVFGRGQMKDGVFVPAVLNVGTVMQRGAPENPSQK